LVVHQRPATRTGVGCDGIGAAEWLRQKASSPVRRLRNHAMCDAESLPFRPRTE